MSGASTVTVSSGQTASYTLGIAPSAGSPGTFAFHVRKAAIVCGLHLQSVDRNCCCGRNRHRGCTDNHRPSPLPLRVAPPSSAGGRALTLAFAVLILPLAWRRRKLRFPIAVLAVLLLGFSGCSSSGGGSGGTPPSSSHHPHHSGRNLHDPGDRDVKRGSACRHPDPGGGLRCRLDCGSRPKLARPSPRFRFPEQAILQSSNRDRTLARTRPKRVQNDRQSNG